MTVPSKAELVRLFDDESLADEAWTAEAVTSWPSLRILATLTREGPASTGELARAVNMDMRDVRDHLDALAEVGLVSTGDDGWQVDADHIQFTLDLQDEFDLSHSVETARPTPVSTAGESAAATSSADADEQVPESAPGLLGRIKRSVRGWLGRR